MNLRKFTVLKLLEGGKTELLEDLKAEFFSDVIDIVEKKYQEGWAIRISDKKISMEFMNKGNTISVEVEPSQTQPIVEDHKG